MSPFDRPCAPPAHPSTTSPRRDRPGQKLRLGGDAVAPSRLTSCISHTGPEESSGASTLPSGPAQPPGAGPGGTRRALPLTLCQRPPSLLHAIVFPPRRTYVSVRTPLPPSPLSPPPHPPNSPMLWGLVVCLNTKILVHFLDIQLEAQLSELAEVKLSHDLQPMPRPVPRLTWTQCPGIVVVWVPAVQIGELPREPAVQLRV